MEATHQEHSPLSDPQILLADNKSIEAQGHIKGYSTAKRGSGLTEFDGCSDARAAVDMFVPRDDIIFRPSIAAAGNKEGSKYIINHPATKQIIVIQHFDGSTVSTNEPPKGCGGLGVKSERLKNNEPIAGEGILKFVDTRIHAPGIYNASYREALSLAQHTDKPILAAALDHLTGLIHPFVLLTDEGRTAVASIPFGKFGNPSYIYRNGIPDLPDAKLPKAFLDILKTNRKQVEHIRHTNPNFAQSQKIQDPIAITLTTSLIPPGHRYPGIFGEANTNFTIAMPIVKDNSIITGINKHAFETDVLAQLEYPIGNAITAQTGHGGHGFGSTHRLIVETPDIELSRSLAKNIAGQPWMQQWLSVSQNQIWTAEVVTGQTKVMETFT